MLKLDKISNSVTSIAALDPELKTFDIIMTTKYGSTYNSYLIDGGDEIALIDTAKEHYFDEYIQELEKRCDLNKIKYIIVNHTEPDHSGEIHNLLEKLPHVTIVGSPCALGFLKDIANKDFKSIPVKENFELKVGNKTLQFAIAPNLHWPDSMFTYLKEEQMLFTCDVFGAHYNTHNLYNSKVENYEDYLDAFKYYYDCIFSPFKPFVIAGMKKIEAFNYKMICPSHGPIISDNLDWYKEKYIEWSNDVEEKEGKIAICYTSAYSYSKNIAKTIGNILRQEGFEISDIDLLEKTKEEAIHEIKSSEAFLIGSPTLNGDAVPPIWELLLELNPYDICGKICAAFGSFGWSGEAVRNIESRLSMIKCEVMRPGLKIKFNPDSNIKQEKIIAFAKAFSKKVLSTRRVCNNEWVQIKTGKWKCLVCGEIFEGEYPPEICPACGAPQDQFIEITEETINFKSESEEKIIVIGSGIAAISAIEAIRKRNSKCSIEMITKDSTLPYYRILLSKKLAETKEVELLKDQKWFYDNNINISFNTEVKKILPDENKIIINNNTAKTYDKLIIATGAKNNVRPIHGDDKNGVFSLRNKEDFEKIYEFAYRDYVKEVIVIGGGILGIEMASSMSRLRKKTTVIEFAPRIMLRQLDTDGSEIFQKHLKKSNIDIYTSETVEEIFGTGQDYKEVCGIKLSNSQKTLSCQMIIEATGIKTNIEIAKDTNIATNKGIIVNENMQTNYENIYSCGDIAEFNNKNIGLWPIALEMGKTAGANAIGDKIKYTEKPIAVSFNELNYKIFTIGDIGQDPEKDYQKLELADPKQEIYRKFFFIDNQFVGGILMGDTKKAIQLRRALDNGSTMQQFLDTHFLDEE